MTFKFNGGYGAVLCDNCRVIVASGKKLLNYFLLMNLKVNIQ